MIKKPCVECIAVVVVEVAVMLMVGEMHPKMLVVWDRNFVPATISSQLSLKLN